MQFGHKFGAIDGFGNRIALSGRDVAGQFGNGDPLDFDDGIGAAVHVPRKRADAVRRKIEPGAVDCPAAAAQGDQGKK
jgi:hypothetical protein